MKDYFKLDNKIAVITGGFGQLGQSFAVSLVDYGAQVAVIDIIDKPNKINEKFSKYYNENKIISFNADITDKKQINNCLMDIKNKIGSPSILINNAALDSPPNSSFDENCAFENYSVDSLDKIYNVNVKGTFICCQVFGKEMAENNGGSIINISSIYGLLSPNQDIYEYKRKNGNEWYKPVAYSITKSAILNLTRYLATYWAKKNVRVNTLSPAGIFNNQDQEFLDEYSKRIPIGRMADQNELNGGIIFLSSDASTYMTGSNLIIDGGWTAW